MRVLQVLGNLGYGGIESFLMNVYRHIDREKIQFDFLVRSNDNGEKVNEIEAMGGRIFYSPSFTKKPVSNYIYVKKFFEEHAREYTAVHVHCNSLIYPLPIVMAKKSGIKTIILHSHNTCNHGRPVSLYHRYNENRCDKFLDYRFACSEEAGRWMFDGRPFTVIHNGIDLDVFSFNEQTRIEYREKLGFAGDDRIIGHVGRFCYQKNQEFLIELLKELLKKSENYKLLLVGDGETRADVEQKAKDLGVLNNIVFAGNVNNVQDYMQAMDVFAFPSRYEGLGIVAIEAQARGIPVVASTCVPEEMKLTENVEFLPLENLQSWVDFLTDCSTLLRFADRDGIVKAGYDISTSAMKLTSIYSETGGDREKI